MIRRQYQKVGTAFLKARRAALLGDEPGIGKTIQAIDASKGSASLLITVPAQLRLHWKGYVEKYHNRSVELITEQKYKIDDVNPCVIVSYDLMQRDEIFKQLKSRLWSCAIFDEAHYLKNIKSGRKTESNKLGAVMRTKRAIGKGGLISNCRQMFFLTGSPVFNRPVDLFPLLRAFRKEQLGPYTDYMSFTQRYCGGFYNNQGFWQATGATNQEELKRILDGFMLRRLAVDVLPELPERRVSVINLEGGAKVLSIEEAMSSEQKDSYANLGEMATVRKEVGIAKLPECVDYLKMMLEGRDKVLVFAYHRDVIDTLCEKLAVYQPKKIYGGMNETVKINNKHRFITDPSSRLLIGNLISMGQGLDGLQNVCHTVNFVEWSYLSEEINQGIKRLHRFGQNKLVDVRFLTINNSVESKMIASAVKKHNVIHNLVGHSEKELIC